LVMIAAASLVAAACVVVARAASLVTPVLTDAVVERGLPAAVPPAPPLVWVMTARPLTAAAVAAGTVAASVALAAPAVDLLVQDLGP